jgi:hypothetical protein
MLIEAGRKDEPLRPIIDLVVVIRVAEKVNTVGLRI